MSFNFNSLLLSFIPLFVAIDILRVVPVFLSLTERMDRRERHSFITQATFKALGITENDFRVGGGIVLLVLAVSDLLVPPSKQRRPESSVGIVPIGVPLIIGPAALTTILILVDTHGYVVTIISLLLNLIIVWFVFRFSDVVIKLMGDVGSKAVAKVAELFMAGIAVMMIRVGLSGMIKSY
jgi:multiple antibiotic resistance protein